MKKPYCPDCKTKGIKSILIETSKEIYCPKCGLVVDDSLFNYEECDESTGNGKIAKYKDGDIFRTKPTRF